MKGVAVMAMAMAMAILFLACQAQAAGIYTGSDGKQVALGSLPQVVASGGKISQSDLTSVLEANFNTSGNVTAGSGKVGIPTFGEFEQLVENLSADIQGKKLAEKAKKTAEQQGWGSVRIGQKEGDYYSVAAVSHNGKVVAAQIICNTQMMLASTGPDKAMTVL